MAKRVQLVNPIYLDVPMMTSFLAAIEDGVAFGSDVTRTQNKQKSLGAEGEGKAGIPTVPILSTLLNFDLRGKITTNGSTGSSEEIKLIRKHTESSLFMSLRHNLQASNSISKIQSIHDIDNLEHADLIEVTGHIFRSPLSEFLDGILRILGLFGIEAPNDENQSEPQKQQRKSKASTSTQRANTLQQKTTNPLSEIEQFNSDPEKAFILKMLNRMREDILSSKVVDVVMRPVGLGEEDLSIVIALSLEFLTDSAFQTLLSGQFTVLGKVVQVLKDEGNISLYQRTTFSYLDSSFVNTLLDSFKQQQQPFFSLPENPSIVEAPVIQLIPLAVYV
jgi:hypothetical protein